MTKSLLTAIVCICLLQQIASGQTTITSSSIPVVGDHINYYIMSNPDLEELKKNGTNVVWNLSGQSGSGSVAYVYKNPAEGEHGQLFSDANLLEIGMGGIETYFYNDHTGMSILGQEMGIDIIDQLASIGRLETKAQYLKTPLTTDQGFNSNTALTINIPVSLIPDSILNQLPIQPDSLRLRYTIIHMNIAGGAGTLKLPGKDFEALKVNSLSRFIPIFEAKVPVFGWLDVTSFVPFDFVKQEIAFNGYTFWSPNERGFIARFLEPITPVATPQYLYTANGTILGNKVKAEVTQLQMFPNPIQSHIIIGDNQLSGSIKQVLIVDALGRTIIHNAQISDHKVDVHHLTSGIYTIRLIGQDGRIYTNQFVKI